MYISRFTRSVIFEENSFVAQSRAQPQIIRAANLEPRHFMSRCTNLVVLTTSAVVCLLSYMLLRKLLSWNTQSKVVPFAANMATGNGDWKSATSIYDFSAIDIDGNEVSLEKYRGHVAVIVNVASN